MWLGELGWCHRPVGKQPDAVPLHQLSDLTYSSLPSKGCYLLQGAQVSQAQLWSRAAVLGGEELDPQPFPHSSPNCIINVPEIKQFP